MIYRKLDASGDYSFGHQGADFYANVPEAVAQAVRTRLELFQGEWFLDTTAGTPYSSQILGAGTVAYYDRAIQDVILGTQGVTGLTAYSSSINPSSRAAMVNATISTAYGSASITAAV